MDPLFQDLIDRLNHFSDQFVELGEGVRKAVLVADLDPEMSLTRARKVLEYVVRDVFERRVQEPPGTRPLENLLQRLVKDGFFPERLDAYANTVRKLGNVGTHNFNERVTSADVFQSLTQLMPILEWYFEVERPEAGLSLDAPPSSERARSGLPPTDKTDRPEAFVPVVPKGLRSFDANDSNFFLQLLPGPRDQDGLPESIRFWKLRIEDSNDLTFTVGVIYGPSGCGKSSLVKAGLLPRLAKRITSVYVEATPDETETRLLIGLRRKLATLPADLDLKQTISAIRQGQRLRADQKIVIVLDQFEQWLHAHRTELDTELAQALRQCDGEHIQCVVMVRDDFWMALTRFMSELGIELHQGQNAAPVDLFDLIHARKVLAAFGRSYGRLPDDPISLSRDQEMFLNQAINGLAQDGRVISIRLTLFAEMVKGKFWSPATLKEVGGMEGVGVAFLEETFASAALRSHQRAAQAVLKALLPESGTDIKGNMRSQEELREASGYAGRPGEFGDLLRILDSDLRLITPTDPESSTGGGQPASPKGERYFQLTHDYLVHSLRDWLTRKQRETRCGRAELRLAELSSLWNSKPENRHLPSALEWTNIRLLTRKKDWNESQRRMMKRAGRLHGLRTLGVVAGLVTLVLLGLDIRRRVVEANREMVATGLVDQVVGANIAQVPNIVRSMGGYRRWVDPALRQVIERSSERSPERLHAGLALLPVDDGQVEYLFQRLLSATENELPVLRDALKTHQSTLTPKLWTVLESAKPDAGLLPAASALAGYDPDNARWESAGGKVAQALVSVNSLLLRPWIEALRPVRGKLTAPLATIFRDRNRSESERAQATDILTDYASDDLYLITNLLMDADPTAYAGFFLIAQRQEAKTLQFLQAKIAKKATIPDSDKDSEMVKDRLAERQARAAITLLRMGKAGEIIPLLRHSADPRLKSFIVNWLNPLGADPKILAAELGRIDPNANPTHVQGQQFMDAILFHPETSQRRALILALGTYGTEGLSPGEREPLIGKLLDLFRNDSDSGIHGAVEWTLRQWGQQDKLKEVDAQLMKLKDRGEHRWFVNSQGQTFALIDGPVEFHMGSPPNEPHRSLDETLHRRTIPRRLFIAANEVTVEQFQQFVQADPRHKQYGTPQNLLDQYSSPKQGGPMIGVLWYAAAAYCNWLSRKENLPECYEPNDEGQYAEGMKIRADALQRTGYRLPTEAEWEYACRAGAMTSRYYGLSEELLGQYAWYLTNTFGDRAQPCGTKLPNDLGLFDMLGNVYEWCNSRYEAHPPDKGGNFDDNMTLYEYIKDTNARPLRGGTFFYIPAYVRSAVRRPVAPSYRDIFIGFRPSRTYP